MQLFYTGAKTFNAKQGDPLKSLGGFVSCTPIPNAQLNNLFSDKSKFGIEQNNFTTIAIMLLNNLASGKNVTDVFMWFDFPANPFTILELAFVDVTVSTDGEVSMEKISSPRSLPFTVTTPPGFTIANGEANKINLGDLDFSKYLGIYIKETFVADLLDNFECDTLEANVNTDGTIKTPLDTQEDISVQFDFTEV